MSEICANVASEHKGEHCLMIEGAVEWLHVPPCHNDQISGQDTIYVIDSFWQEFKH